MTEGRLETESRCRECLAIIKGEVTSNNLSKRRVRTRTHGVVGGTGVSHPLLPDFIRYLDRKNKEEVDYERFFQNNRNPFFEYIFYLL